MPRTEVPEEQKRVRDISELKTLFPTEKRVVHIVSDPNGESNFYYWDFQANPSNADGVNIVESNLVEFAQGGSNEGAWVKGRTSISALQGVDSFGEAAQDAVEEALVGGDNVNIQYDDQNDNITINADPDVSVDAVVTVQDSGTEVSSQIATFDFGDDLSVTNPTTGKVTINASATAATSIEDSGSNVLSNASSINFDENLNVEDDGDGTVTINSSGQPLEIVDDTTTVESDTVKITFDDRLSANSSTSNEVQINAASDLSLYDASNLTSDDISEGTENLYFTPENTANQFQSGGDIEYDKNIFNPYQIIDSSFSNGQSFDVSSETGLPTGIEFGDGGNKLFVISGSDSEILEYNLENPYDLSSSITYTGNAFFVGDQQVSPEDLAFNSDGTKMFVIGTDPDTVFEYNISTGFDLSSNVSYSGNSKQLFEQTGAASSVAFNGDGSKMYVIGFDSSKIFEYSLENGFDLFSAVTYSGNSFDLSSQDSEVTSVAFSGAGDRFFAGGKGTNKIYEYVLNGGAFDLSAGAQYSENSFDVSSTYSDVRGVEFSGDGSRFFVVGTNANVIRGYDATANIPASFNLDISQLSAEELFGSKTTDKLPEGDNNLYFSEQRARDSLSAGGDLSYDSSTGEFSFDFDTAFSSKNTDSLSEGSNKYFTSSRVFSSNQSQLVGGTNINIAEDTANETFTFNFTGTSKVTVQSGGTDVEDASTINFGNLISAETNQTGKATINVDGDLQNYDNSNSGFISDISGFTTDDLSEGSNLYYTDSRVSSLLKEGNDISLSFDSANGELTISSQASSNLSIENSTTEVASAVNGINFGSGISVSDDGDGTVTATSGAQINVTDSGSNETSNIDTLNFRKGLSITDQGSGTVAVDGNQFVTGSETFSGDGSTKQFSFSHGLSSKPEIWTIEPTSEDSAIPSYSEADSTNVTIYYSTAPPSGTDNLTFNYVIEP